jgi:hypothetical protein
VPLLWANVEEVKNASATPTNNLSAREQQNEMCRFINLSFKTGQDFWRSNERNFEGVNILPPIVEGKIKKL